MGPQIFFVFSFHINSGVSLERKCFMPFKTAMYYEEGKLVNTQMPESNNPAEITPVISIAGAIDLCIRQLVTEKITGVLFIELLELKDNPENIMIDFDIEPKEATPQVEQAIDLFYKNQQKPDRPNSDQQK